MFARTKMEVRLPGQEDRKKKTERKKLSTLIVLIVLVFSTVFLSLLAYYFAQEARQLRNADPLTIEEELSRTIRDVGSVYLLPENEIPTLAVVDSSENLPDQKFFSRAKVGDRVLMYVEAKKAILWRPSTKQIIEVGPIELSSSRSSSGEEFPGDPFAQ